MRTIKTFNDYKRMKTTSINTEDYPEVIVCKGKKCNVKDKEKDDEIVLEPKKKKK